MTFTLLMRIALGGTSSVKTAPTQPRSQVLLLLVLQGARGVGEDPGNEVVPQTIFGTPYNPARSPHEMKNMHVEKG